jgi:hypothetical protein
VCGTPIQDINEHLRRAWLKVASMSTLPADKVSMLLVEFQSRWISDMDSHFHVLFSPPTVRFAQISCAVH